MKRFFFSLLLSACLLSNTFANSDDGEQAEGKGEWQKAVSIYLDILIKDPKRLDLWLRVASIQTHLKNYNDALDAYKHALLLQPNNPEIFKNISEFYSEFNQPKDALTNINQAVKLKPNDINYLIDRAKIANWNNDLPTALDSYQRILVLNKNATGKIDPIEIFTQIGNLQNQMKHYPEAIIAFKQAIQINPKNPVLYQNLSQTYSAAKQPKEALDAINQALKLDPNNSEYLNAKATLAGWTKDNKLAIETYEQILSLNKNSNTASKSVDSLIQIGNLQSQMHHYPEAIITFKKAIQLNPKNAGLYQNLSQIYSEANQPKDALNMIDQALKLDPNNIDYLNSKAKLATWIADNKLAIETYHKILKISPKNKDAQKGLATVEKFSTQKTSIATKEVKKLTPLEQLLATANNASSLHNYNEAAKAMKEAIQLKPGDATLYSQLSEIYSIANQPKLALPSINKAVALEPTNIKYLLAQGQIASWAGDTAQMQKTYERILQLKPNDENAMLNLGHALSWQGKTDETIKVYKKFLLLYPQNAEAWIEYAEILSWTQNYLGSFKALMHYRQLKGETKEYLKTTARILAWVGRFKSALAINEPLLHKKENDPYLLSTEVVALTNAFRINNALYFLNKLNKATPKDNETNGLNKVILTPIRTNLNAEADYTAASDTTKIADFPMYAQIFLNPTTSLLLRGLYETASAALDSGFQTIYGTTTIYDHSAMAGFTKQMFALNLTGLIGGLKIQNGNKHGIYYASVNTNIGERAIVTYENQYNIYRPYLTPQSPKLISLQIMESRNDIALQWQPFVQKYLNAVVSYSDLSDFNNYWHFNIWPKARIYGSEHWLVTVGFDADIWKYKRVSDSGYYSPLLFNGYEGTVELYYNYSENIGCSLSGGFGLQKDETLPHYFYEEDLGVRLYLGIYTDWELQLGAAYTLRENQISNYNSWSAAAVLTRRL